MSARSAPQTKPRPSSAWLSHFCRQNCAMILGMWSDELLSFEEISQRIAAELPDYYVPPSMLRFTMLTDPRLSAAYFAAATDRAHTLAEQVLGHAQMLARNGEDDKAAAIKLKLASKYSPRHYGDRLEVQPSGEIKPGELGTVPDSVLEGLIQRKLADDSRAA